MGGVLTLWQVADSDPRTLGVGGGAGQVIQVVLRGGRRGDELQCAAAGTHLRIAALNSRWDCTSHRPARFWCSTTC
jgi:hypothetical protein